MGVRGIERGRCVRHALAAALLTSLALCAQASAARRPAATFSVTATGSEIVSATKQGEGERCPDGEADEGVQFSAPAVRIRVRDTGPFLELTGLSGKGEDGRQPFTIAGTVARSESGAFTCEIPPETPPDCGTRPFGGIGMWLQGTAVRRGRLTVFVSLHSENPPDVFRSCPVLGGFPNLFVTHAPKIGLKASTLFDRRRRTLVLNAVENTESEAAGVSTHVEMAITLRMRRV
jgi:hypothetical protein